MTAWYEHDSNQTLHGDDNPKEECRPCDRKRFQCCKMITHAVLVKSSSGASIKLWQNTDCTTENVVYLISCNSCLLNKRMNGHRDDWRHSWFEGPQYLNILAPKIMTFWVISLHGQITPENSVRATVLGVCTLWLHLATNRGTDSVFCHMIVVLACCIVIRHLHRILKICVSHFCYTNFSWNMFLANVVYLFCALCSCADLSCVCCHKLSFMAQTIKQFVETVNFY